MSKTDQHLVVIPTYHEGENIDPLLQEIFEQLPQIHVLFVDDNSQDDTRPKIRAWQQARPGQVHMLERHSKEGLGRAYIAGFQWALERDYTYIVEMDADLSHRPVDLKKIVAASKLHDVVVGSRYVEGGGTHNWDLRRKIISRAGSLYARSILWLRVQDLTGGFNCWHRQVLEAIDLNTVKSEGYTFQIELKFRAALAGFSIFEQPILFEERRAGQSKMSTRIVLEAIVRVWWLAFQRRAGRRVAKSLTPPGIISL